MGTPILFYEPFDSNGFLSNFFPVNIDVAGVSWPSSEHYYQAQKFQSKERQEELRLAETPDIAFQLSRKYQDEVRDDWLESRVSVMEYIVQQKFTQHTQLAFHLVNTGETELKEHSHKDDFWGDGGDGRGSNELGRILMNVRSELNNQPPFNLVTFIDAAKLPTQWGEFKMHAFIEHSTQKEHLALVYGDIHKVSSPLIRLHSECLTGDALFSARCDCGFQLSRALQNIVNEGAGVLLYLRQEGRGIGLSNKVRAYHLQDEGADTVQANERLGFAADMRNYAFCQGMLGYFGITSVRLMTNNPRKVKALEGANITVVERVALQEGNNPHNHHYLKTKAEKLGHMFDATFIK
ncbi:GTP cyclohydrolase II [Vibrio sp. ZSDE26]|uniref:GTP cyclohydrolase-2 n=1 Tax=Vibrio amylolyticus TaxID=2847292 RepID=A0A9X1XEW0_9VIBR|nr:GTP cyclohydrolase II [Vibrio amylolyticus]MCK6261722.1 GTP cyclohydrolase II [Vibrio amylolyticus]